MSQAPSPAPPPEAAPAPERRDADPAEIGLALCKGLYAATKLGGLWGYDSTVSKDAIAQFAERLREHAAACGETTLRVASEQVFLNGRRVRMDMAGFLAFRYVVELFVTREIGEIRFSGGASERDVVGLLIALNGVGRDAEDPRVEVEKLLTAEGVSEISVAPPQDIEESCDDKQVAGIRDTSIETYFRAAFVAALVHADAKGGKGADVRRAKRVVHDLADLLERDETTLGGLLQVKNFGDYRATHAANVAVLAMNIGKRLGLPRTLVGDLGVAGFMHDIGRPSDDDDDAATDSAPDDHARRGARVLLPQMGYGDGSLRMVLAARHHHDKRSVNGAKAPLFHRILRVADFYDTATTPAGDGKPATSPRMALRLMLRDPERFDPGIVKTAASVVGCFPLGTVVHLDTGENAVVCGRNPHFDSPTRPIVKVLVGEDGEPLAEPKTIDLSKWDREKNRFAHSIAEAYTPSEVYAKTTDYLDTI
jgi:HD-GYP domain-containing protein (c-di-GMP phosphodiesterase class II)